MAEFQMLAGRVTRDRRRAEAMGWTFDGIQAREDVSSNGVMVRCDFRCVCGRQEAFTMALSWTELRSMPIEFLARHLDLVAQIRAGGSFSRKHLLADGYTEAQIAEFERKGEEFDRMEAA